MFLINFAHPLTQEQIQKVEEKLGQKIEKIIEIDAQIDQKRPLVPQIVELVDRVGFTPHDWQTLPFILNPPSLSISAVTLLAEVHGRCGYFPPVLRLRPIEGSLPLQFEVAEIINLHQVREGARKRRG
ncbi:CRISPR-associated protein Csx15 [Caldanaerobacter sp.]|uniref:CRISPR-associated protein Csx15 n=1 Tax=Caldanaerobacter sp. TaxID=2930036 RepID=UPI003C7688BE